MKSKWISLFLILPLLAMTAIVPAFAETVTGNTAPVSAMNETGVIRNPNGGSYVNVRSWPSYEADILTTLDVGSTVEITGASGTWYRVWANGLIGFIHSNFVYLSGGGDEPGANATVRSGPLNMREAPTMRARVVMQLPTGLRVKVVENQGTWSRVESGGVPGYVVTSYLTIDGGSNPTPKPPVETTGANATIRTNGGNLNLRQWAGSDAPVLGSYGNGSRVRVLTSGNSWSRVQVQNQVGYMATQYLIMDSGSGSGGGTSSGYDGVVNNPGSGQVLNLREEPSSTSRSLGQYHNGTYVRILGVGTEWHRVSVNGVTGYMMAKYVRITSSGATPHHTVLGGANGFVNLRSGPGESYSIIRQVTNGSAVSVVIPYPTWSQVLVRQGSGYQGGFMMNTFIR